MGRALIPSTLHLGSNNRSPDPAPRREGGLSEDGTAGEPRPALPGRAAAIRPSVRGQRSRDEPNSLEIQAQQNVIMISRFCAKKL